MLLPPSAENARARVELLPRVAGLSCRSAACRRRRQRQRQQQRRRRRRQLMLPHVMLGLGSLGFVVVCYCAILGGSRTQRCSPAAPQRKRGGICALVTTTTTTTTSQRAVSEASERARVLSSLTCCWQRWRIAYTTSRSQQCCLRRRARSIATYTRLIIT